MIMDMTCTNTMVEDLFSTEPEKWLPALIRMKNAVIGNNRQKHELIALGVVPRLLHIMVEGNGSVGMMTEAAIILGSLAKGSEENIPALLENGSIGVLIKGLNNSNTRYVDACLRCLRTLLDSTVAPVDVIYEDVHTIPQLLAVMPNTMTSQECVAAILAACCQSAHHQTILCSAGVIPAVAPLLVVSQNHKVQIAALSCLAGLCYQNQKVALAVAAATYDGPCLTQWMCNLLARDQPPDVQMAAAKCLTYLCRVSVIHPQDNVIILKTLPTLVRMCKHQRTVEQRVDGAETLAYLINVNADLQKTAAITDHLIPTLLEFLKVGAAMNGDSDHITDLDLRRIKEEKDADQLRCAAFKVYAALGANDEAIRKKIMMLSIEGDSMMEHIVMALNCSVQPVQVAAVRCLHSLSRSVQQLRTSFQDHAVWKPLMKILLSESPRSDEVMTIVSSTLCNLLLEFSPSKEPIVEQGAVELLVNLTRNENPSLRLNGIWALMNMAFSAEQRLKTKILNQLGTDNMFRLLSDSNVDVLMKTLGLLRNLLSNKPHIDHVMEIHGNEIIQAVIMILEGDHSFEVKEQTLCIIANICDGDSARDFVINNDEVLKKLMNYMMHNNVKLQTASTVCISNLVWSEEDGALERQAKLRDLGVQKVLQQLLNTLDSTLFERVKTALQQFTP